MSKITQDTNQKHATGPTPLIEKFVNAARARRNQQPIPFRLSDFYPNLDAWMPLSTQSANLSFIPQPVDATDIAHAPAVVISKTCPLILSNVNGNTNNNNNNNGHKTIHLYSLSFHHFNDRDATRIMKNTLLTSDALAIIELQDRSLGMLFLLLIAEFPLILLLTILWFPPFSSAAATAGGDGGNFLHLAFTYFIPVLPFLHAWDGVVSCLRTRTFEETLGLAELALGGQSARIVSCEYGGGGGLGEDGRTGEHGRMSEHVIVAVCGEWKFVGVRKLHTWPFGYMNAFLAQKRIVDTNADTADTADDQVDG
jgi:hypothetical protein